MTRIARLNRYLDFVQTHGLISLVNNNRVGTTTLKKFWCIYTWARLKTIDQKIFASPLIEDFLQGRINSLWEKLEE